MSRDRTTIEITRTTWKQLNALKEPGDSFESVIQRLLSDDSTDADELADGTGGPFPMTCACGTRLESPGEALDHSEDCAELTSD